ncbi:hypothetical protein BSKO_12995 [Bryopsis sp. KO-2023]|nr:hypothetical protein BSKO_12995 [Bryopsis sp. KO-2023]
MEEERVKFGLRDCATDDEGSANDSDQESVEFTETDSEDDERGVDGGDLVRQRSWGAYAVDSNAPGDANHSRGAEGEGGLDTASPGASRARGGEWGATLGRHRKRESWGDMLEGDSDEEEDDEFLREITQNGGSGELRLVERRGSEPRPDREPFDVPRAGAFYLHDDRFEHQARRGRGRGRGGRRREPKWKHDKFEELEKGYDGGKKSAPRKQGKGKKILRGGLRKSEEHFVGDGETQQKPREKKLRKKNRRSVSMSHGDFDATPPEDRLPQGVSREQLKVARGGRKVGKQTRASRKSRDETLTSPGGMRSDRMPEKVWKSEGGRGGHRRRGSRGGGGGPGQRGSRWDSDNTTKRNASMDKEEKRGRPSHARAASFDDRRRSSQWDEAPRRPSFSRTSPPPREDRKESRAYSRRGASFDERGNGGGGGRGRSENNSTRGGRGPGVPKRPPGHRRGFSEDTRGSSRMSPTGSAASPSHQFRLNPFAAPFRVMNPNAAPFVPPGSGENEGKRGGGGIPTSPWKQSPQNVPVTGQT